MHTHLSAILGEATVFCVMEAIVAKSSKKHSLTLDIPTQLSRRLRRFSNRSHPVMAEKSEISRQCSKPASLAPTSTSNMRIGSESYFTIDSRELEL